MSEDNKVPALTQERPTRFDVAIGAGGNVGAISIEQERAIAEAQGQLILAKRFPRDLNAAYTELMESCRLAALANVAFYSVPRAGTKVTGPTIRLAEEIARVYGNFEYGHRELSRSADKSEIEVYAWDKEKNNRSVRQITVMHTRDTKEGQTPLRDQKDIDDKIANVASKQVRGRILALLPKWMVESATQECRKTIAGRNDEPLTVRVMKMVDSFNRYGVKVEQLAAYIGKPVDQATQDDFVDMLGVYNALRDGAKVAEYFTHSSPDLINNAAAQEQPPAKRGGRKPKDPAPATPSADATAPASAVPLVAGHDPAAATMAAAIDAGLVPKPAAQAAAAPTPADDDASPFDFSFDGE